MSNQTANYSLLGKNMGFLGFGKKNKLQGKSFSLSENFDGRDKMLGLFNALKSNGREVWQPWDNQMRLDAYSQNAVVFSCVRRRFNSIIEAPLKSGVMEEGVFVESETPQDHLLERPSTILDIDKFLSFYSASKDLTGYAYYIKERNDAGEIISLQPIPATWVTGYAKNSTGTMYGYTVTVNAQSFTIPFVDMGRDYYVDPKNPTCGVGLLEAAERDTQQDGERSTYLQEMLENNKLPGVVLKNQDGWTADAKSDTKKFFETTMGKGKRGGPLFVDGNIVDIDSIAPLADLDWPGLSSLSESRICAAFGVPPQIVGVRAGLEAGTFANYEQAEKSFYRGTMVSVWNSIENYLTQSLFRDEGFEEYYFKFDTRFVRQLQEDQNERHDRIRKDFQGGLLSRGTAQSLLGYEVDENDEFSSEYLVPASLIPQIPGEEPDIDESTDTSPEAF